MLGEMKEMKELLIRKLSNIVSRNFSNYLVQVYGSHATNLCLHWSDIDLCVGPQNGPESETHGGPLGL